MPDILNVARPQAPTVAKPVVVGRKNKRSGSAGKGDVYYCLHAGDDPDGGTVLSSPMSEQDALVASFKKDLYFYRVEKLKAQVTSVSGEVKLVAVPVK